MTRKVSRTRSSTSSEGDADSAMIHQEGRPGGSDPHVSQVVGSDPQGVLGHGQQIFRNSGRYHFPQDLPRFNGEEHTWDKFFSELVYVVSDLTGVDLSLAVKPDIPARTNEYIFQCISKCINSNLYDMICRHKDLGFEAFQFLDRNIGGSIASRQTKVVNEQANLTYHTGEDMIAYTSRFSRLVKDGVKYEMGERPNKHGTFPILITRSILTLPPRFQFWGRGKLSQWQERGGQGYPTVDDYIDLLLDQDKIIQKSEAKYSGRGATNVANIAINKNNNPGLSKNQLRKLKLRMKQASNNDNINNQQIQHGMQGQTTAVNATALRSNKNLQSRPVSKDHWKRKPFKPQTGGAQGHGQVQGHPFNRGPNQSQGQATTSQQQTSSSRGPRPPISCKRCLSRNGLHSAENCPSIKKCNFCNNWSHADYECRWKNNNS